MVWLLSVQLSIDGVPFSMDFHLRYKFLIHEENISSWSASHYVPTQTSNKHSNFLFKNGRPCHACTKFFCKMFKMVYHFYSEERISAGHAWRKVCMTSRIRINMDPQQRYNKKNVFFWKLSCLNHFEVSLYSNFFDLIPNITKIFIYRKNNHQHYAEFLTFITYIFHKHKHHYPTILIIYNTRVS